MYFKEMETWKQAMFLVKFVYELTKGFPKEELYGLTSQIKRAVVSVPANIAEGLGRNHKKDTIQFLHISRGSLYELETLMEIASMMNMITEVQLSEAVGMINRSSKLLNGTIRYFEKPSIK